MFGRRRHERPDSYGARKRASWTGLRRPKLHHACTAFVALLCVAHILVAALTIQHEEIWTNLTVTQVSRLPNTSADPDGCGTVCTESRVGKAAELRAYAGHHRPCAQQLTVSSCSGWDAACGSFCSIASCRGRLVTIELPARLWISCRRCVHREMAHCKHALHWTGCR